MSDSTSENQESGSGSASAAKVEKELDEFLLDDELSGGLQHEGYSPVDLKSSIAMKTGLTAACAGAGWRRSLQEVSL
jgi:hypothetical protein